MCVVCRRSDGANVFVEIYADRIEVVSPGGHPRGLTLAELGHKSVRRHALIADLLHRIGFIEKAVPAYGAFARTFGRRAARSPSSSPAVSSRPHPDVRAKADEHPETPDTDQVTDHVTDQVTGEVRLLHAIAGRTTRLQMQQARGLIHNGHFRAMYLRLALEAGLVEMTVPDKPRNRNQRNHLTPADREYLRQTQER